MTRSVEVASVGGSRARASASWLNGAVEIHPRVTNPLTVAHDHIISESNPPRCRALNSSCAIAATFATRLAWNHADSTQRQCPGAQLTAWSASESHVAASVLVQECHHHHCLIPSHRGAAAAAATRRLHSCSPRPAPPRRQNHAHAHAHDAPAAARPRSRRSPREASGGGGDAPGEGRGARGGSALLRSPAGAPRRSRTPQSY